MQKIATRIFIGSSIAFGLIGMLIVLTSPFAADTPDTPLLELLMRCLFATVFVILPSLALSIAGKYLNK